MVPLYVPVRVTVKVWKYWTIPEKISWVLVQVTQIGELRTPDRSEYTKVSACVGLVVIVILTFPTDWYMPVW